jgi:hypothetical protein
MDDINPSWKLICPPKNWRKPVTINEGDLGLIETIGARLQLVMTRDDKRKKIYLGPAASATAAAPAASKAVANGLRFPSGWSAEVITDGKAGAQYKAVDPVAAPPLIRAFPDAQLSKNFRLSEFRPGKHSYEYIRISPALIRALEEIRARTGMPITVTSGYRPPDYNREVGGVSNSLHVDGLAADIYCDGLSTAQLHTICKQVIGKGGGVGYYPKSGFIHVDLRGYEARWDGT